jgi:hypothetical protein
MTLFFDLAVTIFFCRRRAEFLAAARKGLKPCLRLVSGGRQKLAVAERKKTMEK